MSIEVRNVTKTFGSFKALNDVSVKIGNGELVALLGPSGSGKTTLLRVIAGLEQADPGPGQVLFHDEDMTGHPVGKRRVGFVFQHYALFPHMTVFENVAFGLRVRRRADRPSKKEIRDKVHELLRLVQLERLGERYPSQVSGGQRQRVALARALAVEPKVLLLDEPFGALDAKVRRELRRWLRRLHDEMHITSVFVTHDQEEALEVADRVAVLNAGRIEQIGTPEEVYDQPVNPFVYHFIGNVNLFRGRVQEGRAQLVSATERGDDEPAARLYVRPHDIALSRDGNGDSIRARIEQVSFAGSVMHVQLTRLDTHSPIDVELAREQYRSLALKQSDEVFVTLRNARVFPGDEDYSI